MQTVAIIDGVLRMLVITGMAGSLVIAPNAVQLGEIALRQLDKRSRSRNAAALLAYMGKRELIRYDKLSDGNLYVMITHEGRRRVAKVEFNNLKITTPKQWDGRWRLVLFDIEESRRHARNAFALKLRKLGFYRLQKSVWVYPYPCNNEITEIQKAYNLEHHDIVLVEATSLNRETILKEYFEIDT